MFAYRLENRGYHSAAASGEFWRRFAYVWYGEPRVEHTKEYTEWRGRPRPVAPQPGELGLVEVELGVVRREVLHRQLEGPADARVQRLPWGVGERHDWPLQTRVTQHC